MTRLFRSLPVQPPDPRGCAVAIGAFDGVHLGHRHLLARAATVADERGLAAVALSFEPLPREFFAPQAAPARLTPARTRFELMAAAGMDAVGLLRFDARLAAMPATAFVDRVLAGALAARLVVVGPGFRFGQGRAGDIGLLRSRGEALGFAVEEAALRACADGERISATRIRGALAAGDFEGAAAMLGRPYAIAGKVVRGRQLGRKLGYPTANLPVRWRPAVTGILAVRVHGAGLAGWPAVASLGTRPTVGGGPAVLEAHLFDFDGDLYGRRLSVEFVAHLRGERRFDDLPSMVEQMHEDARQARAVLAAPALRASA
ncbi:MAG: bifunctional riboflavin kinase/FAD synthetase [Xanthomonadales bacterium]|nr:bifunctional riboflavin kinase/FAD synthetase [Xanthomonadales bacterium]